MSSFDFSMNQKLCPKIFYSGIWPFHGLKRLGWGQLLHFLGAPASNAGATLILKSREEEGGGGGGVGDISFSEYIDHSKSLNALTILSAMVSF